MGKGSEYTFFKRRDNMAKSYRSSENANHKHNEISPTDVRMALFTKTTDNNYW